MQPHLVPRRTQFSSCDACRRSRVACDAMRIRGSSTSIGGQGACSRCANRGKQCTFDVCRVNLALVQPLLIPMPTAVDEKGGQPPHSASALERWTDLVPHGYCIFRPDSGLKRSTGAEPELNFPFREVSQVMTSSHTYMVQDGRCLRYRLARELFVLCHHGSSE